jgi:glycosyltransferase involved in cell wall biosynthesis
LRIVLASFISSATTTGMGKWTERIAAKLRARGHEVVTLDATVLGLDLGSSLQRHVFGVTVTRWLLRNRGRFDAAVVHEPHALPVCLARRRTGTAVVAMSHGVENRIVGDLRNAAHQGAVHMPLGRLIRHQALWGWREARGFHLAQHVLCLAEVDRKYLVDNLNKAPAEVTCFVNGADPVTAPLDAGAADGVVSLGTWIPEKGSLLLPRIWRQVCSALPGSRLTIAGTGVDRDQVLRGFASEDRDSVHVVPAFSGPDELRGLLGSAGVFLLPSLREGSPLALLEAMSHGLPAVASAVGGVPEIVTDGREGQLYPPLDTDRAARHLCDLLRDVDLRRRMGFAAHVRASVCTWEAAAGAVERACMSAVEM